MHDHLSSDKFIFTYQLFEKTLLNLFQLLVKQSSLSLFGFAILYWLNIKKIEVVLSETKVLVTVVKFEYGH